MVVLYGLTLVKSRVTLAWLEPLEARETLALRETLVLKVQQV
jgi:hypothetical protein